MENRRAMMKIAGAGLATAGSVRAAAKVEKSEDSYASATTIKGDRKLERVQIKMKPPLFCPYHSLSSAAEKGGGGHYYISTPFEHNPFTINASGMSGSPVIMDSVGQFVGFMTTFGFEQSTFAFDGKQTLTVSVPEGQEIFVEKGGDAAWKKYNSLMMQRLNFQPLEDYPAFWSDVEYCTWVEQKVQSKVRRGHFKLLSHDFVKAYIDKLIEFDYPKGKLTLDHGWSVFPDGTLESGFGSWEPDPKTFPDFEKTMRMISEAGFTPGLWIGFPKVHHNSIIGKRYPEILGNWSAGRAVKPNAERWLNPKADIFSYALEVIGRYQKMGVKKFKIDMSYNTKSDMLHIHKALYRAAKLIDPELEMEFHVPDIFFAPFADVNRTNDIWMNPKYDWPGRVKSHYTVTYKSAPGRAINLDHIGGNDTGAQALTEANYLKHLAMYKGKTGYPLVSVLPHHISQKCVDATGEYLWNYDQGERRIVSDFFEA
ncbi:hypothetical protein [Pontiella agarivorans]|uniref:Alpha-galactosidase n=1 Tax=Pontiella agarivorans TaxID=3038953 RepID=A0ABU5MTW6_9BACT|nr:hypothetical protein [Pontiella agarivorans]MDZ8117618.1 hypothetical protein [Pontiella agarivorans]